MTTAELDPVRAIADAVLYEGYLLYPYRASSEKNRSRWQFGVLGPPDAAPAAFGEEPGMTTQVLLAGDAGAAAVSVHLRFLQLQVREVQRLESDGRHTPVGSLTVDGAAVLTWDEAVEHEIALPAMRLTDRVEELHQVPGGEETETLTDARGRPVGRVVRRRAPLTVRVRAHAEAARAAGPGAPADGYRRLTVRVSNEHAGHAADKEAAIRVSLIGTHLLLRADGGEFVSLVDPPAAASAAAASCRQHRCWPVLAGPPGSSDTVLGAPIILYDHPQIADASPGDLFDSTEIDEILTLRVMTMTEEEKAEARATDPRAREIIDRCDTMSPAGLERLHGLLRDPHAPDAGAVAGRRAPAGGSAGPAAAEAARTPGAPDVRDLPEAEFGTGGAPWWDPAADAAVRPGTDAVVIDGVRVAQGSLVRVHPSRRADAQDLFFAGQVARVTAVLSDVDGGVHVALVLVDDPASDLHDWYGRYFYFAPDELEPLPAGEDTGTAEGTGTATPHHREESRS